MEFIDMSEMVGVCDDEYHEEDIDHDRVRKYRGKDIDWVLVDQWPNKSEFSFSSYNTELKTEINMKKDTKLKILGLSIGCVSLITKEAFIPALDNSKSIIPILAMR